MKIVGCPEDTADIVRAAAQESTQTSFYSQMFDVMSNDLVSRDKQGTDAKVEQAEKTGRTALKLGLHHYGYIQPGGMRAQNTLGHSCEPGYLQSLLEN